MRLALIVVLSSLVSAPALAQQSWKDWLPKLPSSPGSEQHDAARHMAPAKLVLRPTSGPEGELQTIRVRVWAAADYRRQTVEWQSRFRRIVERVNALCRGWPGVRFEIVDVRNWERDSEKPSMATLVGDLAQHRPRRRRRSRGRAGGGAAGVPWRHREHRHGALLLEAHGDARAARARRVRRAAPRVRHAHRSRARGAAGVAQGAQGAGHLSARVGAHARGHPQSRARRR